MAGKLAAARERRAVGSEGSLRGGAGRPRRVKVGGGWRWCAEAEEAFFAALAGLRNVRAAAEAVGYSAATAYAQRRARADFAARWRAVLAPLDCARDARAPAGSIVRYAAGGHAKRVRCHTQWSDEVEGLFLDILAATCNVRLAAAEAGVGHTSVYRQRRLRPDFAAKWQVALEQGYARLEMALVRAAGESVEGVAFDADRPIGRMSAETALKVLQSHRAAVTGVGRRSGWQAPPRQLEEVRASIERKVRAIIAARALEGEGGASESGRG